MTLPPLSPDGTLVLPIRHAGQFPLVAGPAISVARALGLAVEILSVIEPDDDADAHLDRLVGIGLEASEATGQPCTVRLLVTEDVLSTVTGECSGRLVCMATSASPHTDLHYVGSHAASILAESSSPVLLVGPQVDSTARATEVVAAVSGQIESTSVIPYAAQLSRSLDLPLATIHVHGPDGVSSGDDHMRLWFPGELHTSLDVEPIAGTDVAAALTDRAASAIVAVMTHARLGLAWIAEGSVAFDVVSSSPHPVLAVGPRIGSVLDEPAESTTIREVVEIVRPKSSATADS